jgi:hypothetical protein
MKKFFVYGTLYLISLYNYFIMYDIKFVFSIKLIRQFKGGAKKNSGESKLPKALPKNTNLQNPKGDSCQYIVEPPCG